MDSKSESLSAQPPTFQILDTIDGQFCNEEIFVRLLHFWEARNFKKANILMGVELLLLDSQGNAVQGFISANRLFRHENSLKRGSVYKFKKFMIRPAKTLYQVSAHKHTICFTDLTSMVEVLDGDHNIAAQKFRIRLFQDFAAIADRDDHLFDVIGQLRLISGDNLRSPTTTETPAAFAENRSKDRVFLHLLMQDGQTIRANLWGNIAATFRERWNATTVQPTVLLITTFNPKNIGGAVTLNSTSSTRLYFDTDLTETRDFMTWLGDEQEKIPTVTTASSAITKLETVTINEIHKFLQNQPQKVSFYCVATVLDVLGQYGWYYISCTNSRCNTKLAKSATSLYCTTCKKTNNVGLIRYRFEISVRDRNEDVATFVLFDTDGKNIAGRQARDVLNDSLEAASDAGTEKVQTTTPLCLKSIIGRTCNFQIKLTEYNFGASRQTFTVSRIVADNVDFDIKANEEISTGEDAEPKSGTTNLEGSITAASVTIKAEEMGKMEATSTDKPTGAADFDNQICPSIGKPATTMESTISSSEESNGEKTVKRPRLGN